jgi:hypothetical protein
VLGYGELQAARERERLPELTEACFPGDRFWDRLTELPRESLTTGVGLAAAEHAMTRLVGLPVMSR